MKLISLFLFIFFITVVILSPSAFSQTTNAQAILTWRANNFFPSDYQGKALAISETLITVSVETLLNNKLIDTSRALISWELDNHPNGNGEGMKDMAFRVTKVFGDNHFVKVTIRTNNETVVGSVRIPVSLPSLVVETPFPSNIISGGAQLILKIVPYFMNISSLNNLLFYHTINGVAQTPLSSNELTLKIGTPQSGSQNALTITSIAQNKINQLESVKASTQLTIQ